MTKMQREFDEMMESLIKEDNEMIVLNNQDLTKTTEKVKSDIPKYWEKDWINQKIDQVENPKHKMLFFLLWRSGIRVTEAINIRKQDIDFENYTLKTRWLKSRKYKHRIVPIHPELRNILQVYTAPLKHEDLLFPFTRQRAWQLTQKHFNGNPHQFRHSFAVNWLRCKGDFVLLSRILGHDKIQTTMEYLKIVPIDQGKELMKIQF